VDAVTRWRPLVQTITAAEGAAAGVTVSPDLVLAIIGTESSGDPNAMRTEPSGVTSYGLMQVLDSTARDLGLTAAPDALLIPDVGIRFGVRYLAHQLARYGGNVANAVAAYNAGSVRFDQQERIVNQAYLDRVASWLQRIRAAGPSLSLVGLGLALLALLVYGRRGARR